MGSLNREKDTSGGFKLLGASAFGRLCGSRSNTASRIEARVQFSTVMQLLTYLRHLDCPGRQTCFRGSTSQQCQDFLRRGCTAALVTQSNEPGCVDRTIEGHADSCVLVFADARRRAFFWHDAHVTFLLRTTPFKAQNCKDTCEGACATQTRGHPALLSCLIGLLRPHATHASSCCGHSGLAYRQSRPLPHQREWVDQTSVAGELPAV